MAACILSIPCTVASWNLSYQEGLESRDKQREKEEGTEQETKWWWALMIQMRAPLEKISWQQYEDTYFLR